MDGRDVFLHYTAVEILFKKAASRTQIFVLNKEISMYKLLTSCTTTTFLYLDHLHAYMGTGPRLGGVHWRPYE